MSELSISPSWWDRQLDVPCRSIICGRTNTGKSYFSRWLLYLLCDKLDLLWVFSPTVRPSDWSGVCVSHHILPEWDDGVVASIFSSQQSLLDSGKSLPHIMILVDDCIWDMRKENRWLGKIFTMGRHWNLSCIIITQKFRLLSQAVRLNVDRVFVFKITNSLEKDSLWSEYGSSSKISWFRNISSWTDNFGVVVIDNLVPDENLMLKRERAPSLIPSFYIEKSKVD